MARVYVVLVRMIGLDWMDNICTWFHFDQLDQFLFRRTMASTFALDLCRPILIDGCRFALGLLPDQPESATALSAATVMADDALWITGKAQKQLELLGG